jgi:hypothetical protein
MDGWMGEDQRGRRTTERERERGGEKRALKNKGILVPEKIVPDSRLLLVFLMML